MGDNSLVSFCILAYNQEKYIVECVRSALNQTFSPLEIIISDDCSTDKTWTLIEKTVQGFSGVHSVKTFRNEQNLGLAAHFSLIACQKATGDYMIFLGGDDVSLSFHTRVAMNYLSKFPKVSVFDFNCVVIDEDGEIKGGSTLNKTLQTFTIADYLSMRRIDSFAPGRLIRKEIFQSFGPIDSSSPTEDSIIVLRALITGALMRIDEKLVKYRRHERNISSESNLLRMDNNLIASQFQRDINRGYKKGLIDERIFRRLLIRSEFDPKLRRLRFIDSFIKKKVMRRIYKANYLFCLIIGAKNSN